MGCFVLWVSMYDEHVEMEEYGWKFSANIFSIERKITNKIIPKSLTSAPCEIFLKFTFTVFIYVCVCF